MTILEMIAEWRKGCGNTVTDHDGNIVDMSLHPERCAECTIGLINAIEKEASGGVSVSDLRIGRVPISEYIRKAPELAAMPMKNHYRGWKNDK